MTTEKDNNLEQQDELFDVQTEPSQSDIEAELLLARQASGRRKQDAPAAVAKRVALRTVTYIILLVGAFLMLFPFLWMVLSSFKTGNEAALEFTFFPKKWVWESYHALFTESDFPIFTALGNTILIEVSVIIVGTFVSALAAFSFAKLKLRHKTFWLLFLMSGMMVPYATLMLPQYRAFEALNMTDTLWPLILPGFFGNISMMFFLIQYMRGVPSAYLEAARIDGASHFTCFLRVMFPLIKTAIAAQVIFWFVGIWNDYFAPSLYLTSRENMTLQVLLGQLNSGTSAKYLPMSLAGSVLSSIPMLIIYITCQKFFIESLTISGVKG